MTPYQYKDVKTLAYDILDSINYSNGFIPVTFDIFIHEEDFNKFENEIKINKLVFTKTKGTSTNTYDGPNGITFNFIVKTKTTTLLEELGWKKCMSNTWAGYDDYYIDLPSNIGFYTTATFHYGKFDDRCCMIFHRYFDHRTSNDVESKLDDGDSIYVLREMMVSSNEEVNVLMKLFKMKQWVE